MNVSVWEETWGNPQILPPAQIHCQICHQVFGEPRIETYTKTDNCISLSDLGNWTNDLFCWVVEAFCWEAWQTSYAVWKSCLRYQLQNMMTSELSVKRRVAPLPGPGYLPTRCKNLISIVALALSLPPSQAGTVRTILQGGQSRPRRMKLLARRYKDNGVILSSALTSWTQSSVVCAVSGPLLHHSLVTLLSE